MKFAVFVFIAGLCLVATTASVVPLEDNDIEFLSDGDVVEIETQGIFNGLYWILKGALLSLKRVYCVIQAANEMKTAAQDFNTNVLACGGVVSSQVQAVMTSCNNVVTDVNNFDSTNNGVCNNSDDSQSTSTTGAKCFWALLKNVLQLRNDIQKTVKLIQQIPTTGTDANVCVDNAVTQLLNTFNSFPSTVTACSKLSHT